MRTKLSFSLICAECGNELEAAGYQEQLDGCVGMTCAYDCQMRMKIKPCSVCMEKATEPVRLFNEALKQLDHWLEKPANRK